MSRNLFFLLAGIGSLGFGALMFFAPATAASMLGIAASPATLSVIHGMGGLIIGTGALNLLARSVQDAAGLRAVLIANVITHTFGLAADFWGIADGALTIVKMAPVELTHLAIGIGSAVYLARLRR